MQDVEGATVVVVIVVVDIVEAVDDVVGLFDCSSSGLPCIYYFQQQIIRFYAECKIPIYWTFQKL
jgi:hypothetical protein